MGLTGEDNVIAGGLAEGEVRGAAAFEESLQINKDFCNFILSLQALLSQFNNTRVRSDFCSGEFKVAKPTSLLPEIDVARCVLFPRWDKGPLNDFSKRNKMALHHLIKLYKATHEDFKIFDGETWRYDEWNSFFSEIGSDSYWRKTEASERCVHDYTTSATSQKVKFEKTGAIPKVKLAMKSSSSTLDSSDTESGTRTSDCDSSSVSECSTPKKKKKSTYRLKSDQREAVVPPNFEMNGKISLKEYLSIFDNYFITKFNGSEYDKTQELGKFLDGKLSEVFQIRGGRKLKYEVMKKELLTWYKKQNVGSKSYWQKQFRDAQPNSQESLDLYGMRLVELYQLAYPRESTERSKELRSHFLNTVPPEVADGVKDAMRVVKATNKKAKIKFSTIVEIAHGVWQDRPKMVNWAYQGGKRPISNSFERREKVVSPTKNSPEKRFRRSSTFCNYCKKKNHTMNNCWRAKRVCLICGGNHVMKDCPKFNPRFNRDNEESRSLNQ